METFFHISEFNNRDSILKNGLVPSKVKLPTHLNGFRNDGLLNYDEDNILYMWEYSQDRNEKFIKDMVFCKTFLTPRNEIAVNDKTTEEFDFSKIYNLNLYKSNYQVFDIYEVTKINEINKNYRPYHWQINTKETGITTYNIPTEYAHDDKILVLSKSIEKNVRIVGQVEFNFTKKRKYDIKLVKGSKNKITK